ncbi:MAG: glycosyltransferase [Chloroflexi bacterium]|nr:glycosyltransferase [Chloroflexota bacterium]
MRVLLIGPEWVAHWTESTRKALVACGQAVEVFYYNSLRVEQFALGLGRRVARVSPRMAKSLGDVQVRWERAMNRRLREIARASRPDLILVLKGETLEAETIAALRGAARRALATWWLDDPLTSRLPADATSSFDAFFLFDKSYFEPLSRAGASAIHFLPCCADPDVFRPIELAAAERRRYECEVSFVGVYYPKRGDILEQMAGLDVNIWGPQWDCADAQRALKRIGGKAWRGKFADEVTSVKVYNASQICLNIHHPQTQVAGLNLRTFEVLAAGAFLLTDRVAGMDELLVPGEETACYASPAQARSQVEHYLAQRDERLRIGQRGRARVLREHTYRHRAQTILEKLGLADS